jgi:MFS family permease
MGASRMLATLAVVVAVSAVGTALLQADAPQVLVLIVLSLFGASAIGWNGVYLAEVARQAPAGKASVATGGTLAMTFLGVVVGPPLFGLIAAASGSYGLAYASLVVPAGLCLWLLLSQRNAFAAAAAPQATQQPG